MCIRDSLNVAGTVADPVYGFIVRHYQFIIPAQLYIQLHAVSALSRRQLKCLQRILRRISGRASVCPYLCLHVPSLTYH